MYAKHVRIFAIHNRQWTGSDTTVRLLDLGGKEYFRYVPADPKQEPYTDLFNKLNQKHPHADRPWRDVSSIWQWGITDDDLESTAARSGFKMLYENGAASWVSISRIRRSSFSVVGKDEPQIPIHLFSVIHGLLAFALGKLTCQLL